MFRLAEISRWVGSAEIFRRNLSIPRHKPHFGYTRPFESAESQYRLKKYEVFYDFLYYVLKVPRK